jgi:hypothetical protein
MLKKVAYWLVWATALLVMLTALQARGRASGESCTAPACQTHLYWQSPLLSPRL